jgi:hypothetical protein
MSEDTSILPVSANQGHMPPSSGDVAQTPESKITGGLASVFRSFTSNRSTKTAILSASSQSATNIQIARELNSPTTLRGGIYGGPSDYEQLYVQLKEGKSLAERRAAAEGLRLALTDYPLSGVRLSQRCRKWVLTSSLLGYECMVCW